MAAQWAWDESLIKKQKKKEKKNTQAGDARIDRKGSALATLAMKCSSQGSLHDN